MALKSNLYFIDTSALCAIISSREEYHLHYVELFKKLLKEPRARFIITDYILDECFTLLRCRIGLSPRMILKIYNDLHQAGLHIHFMGKDDFSRALKIFQKYDDHLLSFTDSSTAAFMKNQGIHQILSTDKDFQIFQFEIL